jgi:hypothetical protein
MEIHCVKYFFSFLTPVPCQDHPECTCTVCLGEYHLLMKYSREHDTETHFSKITKGNPPVFLPVNTRTESEQ